MKRLTLAAALLSACSAAPAAAPSTVTVTETTTVTASTSTAATTAPAGMDTFAGGISAKLIPATEVQCDGYSDTCFGVLVNAENSCPSGVFVEVAFLDGDGAIIGKTNGITAAMGAGDSAKLAMGTKKLPSGTQGRISDTNCLG